MARTSDGQLTRVIGAGDERSLAVKALTTIYKTALVGLEAASGYARGLVAGDKFMGVAFEHVDNSAGGNGGKNVVMYKKGVFPFPLAGAAKTDIGKPIFASDDETVSLDGTGKSYIGYVDDVPDANLVMVAIDPRAVAFSDPLDLTESAGVSVPTPTADAHAATKEYVDEKTDGVSTLTVIGAPALSDDDRFVASGAMKATAYTIANAASADGLARNILITHTAGDTADTLGDAVIVGTDVNDEALTETITVGAGTTTAGTKCFKTVTSITTPGWVIDAAEGTADTIKFGTGNLVGLPEVIAAQANVDLTTLGTAIVEATVTADADEVSKCSVDASTGTYDGTKKLRVWTHK